MVRDVSVFGGGMLPDHSGLQSLFGVVGHLVVEHIGVDVDYEVVGHLESHSIVKKLLVFFSFTPGSPFFGILRWIKQNSRKSMLSYLCHGAF